MKLYLRIFLLLFFPLFVQGQDAAELIAGVNKKFAKVHDYQAEVKIDTRIAFLKILPQQAKIYYRKPSQFKVKSEGIAILPKQNFSQLFELLANPASYNAFVTGSEMLSGKQLSIVQVLPVSDTSDLVLAKLWIEPGESLVHKAQLTTRSNGTVIINYKFGSLATYALPDEMEFTIELKKFKLPRAVTSDINSGSGSSNGAKDPKTGKIFLFLNNYQVNKGIPASVFQ